jgi:DNA polymerase-3 subunit delta'
MKRRESDGMDWNQLEQQQKMVATVLTHAIRRHELAHAYLFSGPKGTCKTQAALLLAKTLLCEHPSGIQPCGNCRNCRRIDSGNHPDVVRIGLEAGATTIKKDQIAFLKKEFAYRGIESARKIFILEDADKMTVQAENSLLKFIEEPHSGTLAVLTTSHVHQMLDTILSRCQVLAFIPTSDQTICRMLEQKGYSAHLARPAAKLTHDAAEAAALCADPWFADACSQVLQLIQKLNNPSEPALPYIYEKFAACFDRPERLAIGLDLLLFWYHDLLSLRLKRPEAVIFTDRRNLLDKQVLQLQADKIVRAMSLIIDARAQFDAHVNGLSVLERLAIGLGGIVAE